MNSYFTRKIKIGTKCARRVWFCIWMALLAGKLSVVQLHCLSHSEINKEEKRAAREQHIEFSRGRLMRGVKGRSVQELIDRQRDRPGFWKDTQPRQLSTEKGNFKREQQLERAKTQRDLHAVSVFSSKSLARSGCPFNILQWTSIDVLSRLDPGITRPCPDLADSSSTLPFCRPGVRENWNCCSCRLTGVASVVCAAAHIFQCTAYCLLSVCDAWWDHETFTSRQINCQQLWKC